jgi:hypothetical protein
MRAVSAPELRTFLPPADELPRVRTAFAVQLVPEPFDRENLRTEPIEAGKKKVIASVVI